MNIVLVGHGMVAATHVAAIDASKDVTLYGILGRDPDRAAAFAAGLLASPKVFASVDEVAADPAVDFAVITTPPNARHDLVASLTAAKIPILMEKPVERDLARASALVDLCQENGVPLGIVFQHRARKVSRDLKSLIVAGVLGDIVSVEMRVPWWRDQSYYDEAGRGSFARDGGGVMISQAIHTLDLMLWLAGPVAEVQALMHRTPLHRLEAEDFAGALLTFESGAVGTLTASTACYPGGAESLSIQGTRAHARLEGGVLQVGHLDGRTETHGTTGGTGGGANPMAFTHEWHQAVIEDFADALSKGRPPLCTGREALRAHAVITAMTEASSAGQRTAVTRT